MAFDRDRPLRIGILGAARIAPRAVVEPAAARDDVVVTAVAARDPARARAFAEANGIAGVADDYAALVARDDVDLVYNALPIARHAEWSLAALAAGKPVLCEKSLAVDAAEARAMVAAAEAAGLVLMEAFHYRFHGVIRRAEAVLRSGELGALTGARAEFRVPIPYSLDEIRWRPDQGGGALGDLGCYPTHGLRTLLGAEPEVVSATVAMHEGVDATVSARLRFPGGLPAELSCSMMAEGMAERFAADMVIEGGRGRLHIRNFVMPQLGCRFTVEADGAARDEPVDGPTTFEGQLDHLVRVLNGEDAPLTGGADAIANLVLMDAIRAAGANSVPPPAG